MRRRNLDRRSNTGDDTLPTEGWGCGEDERQRNSREPIFNQLLRGDVPDAVGFVPCAALRHQTGDFHRAEHHKDDGNATKSSVLLQTHL